MWKCSCFLSVSENVTHAKKIPHFLKKVGCCFTICNVKVVHWKHVYPYENVHLGYLFCYSVLVMYQWIPRKVPYFPDCILPIVKDVRLSSLLHFSSYVNVFPRKAPCFPECWLPFVKDVKDVFWLDLVMYKVSQESPILSWMLVINVKDVSRNLVNLWNV